MEDVGRARYSQVQPGTAKYSQVQPGTARYSQVPPGPSCAIFSKRRCFKDIKYDTERSQVGHLGNTWGPLGDHLRTSSFLAA